MRISRSAILDPARNGTFAVTAVALSVFVFAYSTRFGQASILVYYAIWLPLLLLAPSRIAGRARDLVLPGLFILLLLASTLWSVAPAVSLRASVQFATHVVCAVICARLVGARAFNLGMVAGALLVVLYSLANGAHAYDVMDGSYTFVGAFSSKNQLGLYCSLGIFFAVLSGLAPGRRLVRAGLLAAATLFALVLDATHSATSVIALAASLLVLLGATAVLRLDTTLRAAVFLVMLPLVLVCAVGAFELGATDAILVFFGKDPTLTGRTYLWAEGLEAFHAAPVLGTGYMAYWVQGFTDAERLWAEFYIASRTGFHFHNTFVEALVEIGLLGTALLLAIFVTAIAQTVRRLVLRRDRIAAHHTALLTLLLVRSISEVDVLSPYTVGSFLMIYLLVTSGGRRTQVSADLQLAQGQGGPGELTPFAFNAGGRYPPQGSVTG